MIRSPHRRHAAAAGLVLAAAAGAAALGAVRPATVLEQQPGRTVLELVAPVPPGFAEAADPRYVQVSLPGFGTEAAPGAPSLPVWVGRVAIPAGVEPRLRIRAAPAVPLPGLRPAPTPERDVLHLPGDGRPLQPGVDFVEVLREDPRYYAGASPWPARPVDLGESGRFRRQRFVEFRYRPAAFDPATGGLLWYPRVEVELLHPPPAGRTGAAAAAEPGWEPLYRRTLLNYAAGRQLRLPGPPAASAPAGLESVAMTGVTKVFVVADGLHRIDGATLATAAPALAASDPRTWHLENRGVEIPLRIVGESDGTFDPADVLEFYGEARAEPDMELEVDLSPAPALYRELDVGGTNVYVLSASGGPGSGLRMASVDGTPGGLTPEADFVDTARFEEETIFLPLVADDAWYWGPRTNSFDVGGSTAPATRTLTLDLPGLASTTFSAGVKVSFRGTTSSSNVDPDHHLSFLLNGQPLPDLLFDGTGAATLDTTVEQATVLSDPATLEFTAQPVFDGLTEVTNEVVLNRAEVTYRRGFIADGGSLPFEYADGDFGFQVTGLPDADVRVYDLSEQVPGSSLPATKLITGVQVTKDGSTWTAAFEIHPTGEPTRRLLVTADGGIQDLAAGSILEDTPSDLANPANGAGYLIITHPDLIDTTGGSAYSQFVAARAAQGLPVFTAFVDDIYDEFGDSLPGPEPIRDFLAYAFSSWTGWDADGDAVPDPPRFVLFLGDASFDFRQRIDYTGLPQGFFNKVPTAIFYQQSSIISWFSSDVWLASVAGGDYLPEFLVGRLTARSVTDSEALLQKALDYDAPPAGAWASHATFLAGQGKFQAETDEFERISLELEADFVAPPFTAEHLLYFSDFGGSDAAGMNAAIMAAIDDGTALVDFIGHGNFTKWGLAALYQSTDVALQANGGMQPFVLIENCLSGGFAWHFRPAMGEELTLAAGKGAIAAFAPAGLSASFVGEPVADSLMAAAYGPDKVREVGSLAATGLVALLDLGFTVDAMAYELLGDPSARLALPAPAAPTGVSAVGDNGVVHLSWTASADAVDGYLVLRTEDLAQPYTEITGGPLAATSFDDLGVVNATTYYYVVLAVQGGFESAWSNQNRDCDVDGPDCVKATPTNPFPPSAPAGVFAEPAMGQPDQVRVSWAPNPEGDIAVYRVHYGLASGSYSGQAEVAGTQTEAVIAGLSTGVEHFFAVEAENTGGLLSPLSEEVRATPRFLLGTRPPAAVSGVQVVVAPGDPTSVDVMWDPVTVDIYGLAETVVSYEVYAGTTPTFVPTLGSPLGSVAAPELEYRHLGAVPLPDSQHYVVLAVDDQGLRSPVGQDLPDGIGDLSLTLQGDGQTVDLAWSPVTQTVGGGAAVVSHYEVHGGTAPVEPSTVNGATLLGEPAAPGFSHLPPVGGIFYYTVLAVDARGSRSPY